MGKKCYLQNKFAHTVYSFLFLSHRDRGCFRVYPNEVPC